MTTFKVGDLVKKSSGYKFYGIVVSRFKKRCSSEERVVVQDLNGVLHIYSDANLTIFRSQNWVPIEDAIDKNRIFFDDKNPGEISSRLKVFIKWGSHFEHADPYYFTKWIYTLGISMNFYKCTEEDIIYYKLRDGTFPIGCDHLVNENSNDSLTLL
jgi:hypothetical protein